MRSPASSAASTGTTHEEHTVSTTYTVTGMTCEHCVASVTEEVSDLDGASVVSVDLESGELVVEGDVHRDQVQAAVQEAGYDLTPA